MRPLRIFGHSRLRSLTVCAVVGAAVLVPLAAGSTARAGALLPPKGLKSFQTRLGDAPGQTPSFSRTPAFAWKPVRGASRYEVQVSTGERFGSGGTVVWSSRSAVPAAAMPISLPWMASRPLYWRVRSVAASATSAWSSPARFRVQAPAAPERVAGGPGYVRWSGEPGATGYDVWFTDLGRIVSTTSTTADLRDYYAADAPATAQWRVRAQRRLYGSDKRALPLVSYGPWSPVFKTIVTLRSPSRLLSVAEGATGSPVPAMQGQIPTFLFRAADRSALHHVYVTSDSACNDVVFNSAVVRGSAFAPRAVQVASESRDPVAANDGPVFAQGGSRVKPSESGTTRGVASASGDAGSAAIGGGAAAGAAAATPVWARVDLAPGRYYWTVIPVVRRDDDSYYDVKSVRAACKSNRGSFVVAGPPPSLGTTKAPFATGLTTSGRLASATGSAPRVYGSPLVAWKPVRGANRYEVEWTRSPQRWPGEAGLRTFSTAAVLPLAPGTWWYRVRGRNALAIGNGTMSWSPPARVQVTTPTFAVVR